MLRAGWGIGFILEGLASGRWTFGDSQGGAWLPLTVGIAGALPAASVWADAVFRGGPEADESPPGLTEDKTADRP